MVDERDQEPMSSGSPPERRARRRRTLARFAFWLGVGVVLLLPAVALLTWFVLLPSQRGVRTALVLVNGYLATHTNMRLAAEAVEPSGSGLRLEAPRILLVDGEAVDTLLAAQEIRVQMDWLALLARRPQSYLVEVDAPRFRLAVDDSGRFVLPVWRRGEAGGGADTVSGSSGDLVLRMVGAELELVGIESSTAWWDNGRLEAEMRWSAGSSEWELRDLRGGIPPLGLQIREGRGRATRTGGVLVANPVVIVTDVGSLTGNGRLYEGRVTAEFNAEGWPWEFFADVLAQPALDVEGGVDVRGLVSGPLESPRLDLAVAGDWRTQRFEARLAGMAAEGGWSLERAEIGWGASRVSGHGQFTSEREWWLEARVRDLDLSDVEHFAPALRLPVSRLAGPVRVEGGDGELRIDHERLDGVVGGVTLEGVEGEWTLRGRHAAWRLAGVVAGGRVRSEGTWDGFRLQLTGTGEGVHLAALDSVHTSFAGLEAGEADAEFSLAGPPDSLLASLNVAARRPRYRGLSASALTLTARGRIGKSRAPVVWEAAAESLSLGAVQVPAGRARGRWAARRLDVEEATLERGDTTLVATIVLTQDDAGWSLYAPEARLTAGQASLEADTPIQLRFESGGVRIESASLRGALGELVLAGAWQSEGESSLKLRTSRLEPSLLFPPGRGRVSGAVDLEAVWHGSPGARRLDLRGRADTLFIAGEPWPECTLELDATERSGELVVEALVFRGRGGRISLEGAVDLRDETTGKTDWERIGDARRWRATGSWESLDLAGLNGLLGPARQIRGLTDGSLRLERPGSGARLASAGRARDFAWNGIGVEELTWDVEAGDRQLAVHSVTAERAGETARLQGTVPFVVTRSRDARDWFPDEPIRLTLDLPEGSLRFLPLFLPPVAAADGRLHADLRVEGTTRSPLVFGTLEVEDGVVRPAQREETYREVRLTARLEGDKAIVEHLSARQGKQGTITGSGVIHLFGDRSKSYALDLRAEHAVAHTSGEYSVQFSGDLRVADGPRLEGVWLPLPSITGRVTAETGVILYDFSDPENVIYLTGPPQAPPYVYDLRVDCDGRVYWRTPSANIELKADLTATRTLSGTKLWGTVESLRGHFFFLENRFVMERGVLTFDRADNFDAKLDAEAVAQVTRTVSSGQIDKEEVHIELHGRMQEPEVRLWSSSGLAEKDILALLTFGRFDVGDQSLFGSTDQRVLVGVTGTQYLMRQLAREFPEVSSLFTSVELGTTAATGSELGAKQVYTTFGLNSYVTPELRLGYSQVLGGGSQAAQGELKLWDFSAEYRIGRLFYLTGEVIERRVGSSLSSGTFQNQLEYNLDVRARIDY